jgi:hypothetical protein
MINKKISIPFILIVMLLLAACSSPVSPEIVDIPVTASTQSPTATINPTSNPTQASTQASTPLSVACNQAEFVGDITIPDGSAINSGNTFTKTWRLQNTGTCSWTPSYALIFSNGDLMGGSTVVPLPNQVNPGQTIDLSVHLTAPANSGAYLGSWMLRDSHGTLFGIGANAGQPLLVRITVQSTTLFAVTKVGSWINSPNYSGVCPATFAFYANIWTNSAGTATYYWLRSDGSKSPQGTLTFTGAGVQTVADTWTLGRAGTVTSGLDQIYIDQPNHQSFNPVYFNLTCNPSSPAATRVPSKTPTLVPVPTQPAPTQPAPTQVVPTPTLTPVPIQPAPTQVAPTPTPAPTLTPVPTQVPPTPVPPTQVPPTQAPPTQVPPTQIPPTQVSPTQVPPTQPAPTQPAPTQPPPIQSVPTQVLPAQPNPPQPAPTQAAPPAPTPIPVSLYPLPDPKNPGKQNPPPKPPKPGKQNPPPKPPNPGKHRGNNKH